VLRILLYLANEDGSTCRSDELGAQPCLRGVPPQGSRPLLLRVRTNPSALETAHLGRRQPLRACSCGPESIRFTVFHQEELEPIVQQRQHGGEFQRERRGLRRRFGRGGSRSQERARWVHHQDAGWECAEVFAQQDRGRQAPCVRRAAGDRPATQRWLQPPAPHHCAGITQRDAPRGCQKRTGHTADGVPGHEQDAGGVRIHGEGCARDETS
jgi:hypothetical protein